MLHHEYDALKGYRFFGGGHIVLQRFVHVRCHFQPLPTKLVFAYFDRGSHSFCQKQLKAIPGFKCPHIVPLARFFINTGRHPLQRNIIIHVYSYIYIYIQICSYIYIYV